MKKFFVITEVHIFGLVLLSNWKSFLLPMQEPQRSGTASVQVQSSLFSWSHIMWSAQVRIGFVQMLYCSYMVPAQVTHVFPCPTAKQSHVNFKERVQWRV